MAHLNPYTSERPEEDVFDYLSNSVELQERIYKSDSFSILCETRGRVFGITHGVFLEAFYEAYSIFKQHIEQLRELIASNSDFAVGFREQLKLIGFTGSSRKLKADFINKLSDDVIDTLAGIEDGLQRAGGWVVDRIKRFLHGTNVLLSSLAKAIPGVDVIKEIKDISEFLFVRARR